MCHMLKAHPHAIRAELISAIFPHQNVVQVRRSTMHGGTARLWCPVIEPQILENRGQPLARNGLRGTILGDNFLRRTAQRLLAPADLVGKHSETLDAVGLRLHRPNLALKKSMIVLIVRKIERRLRKGLKSLRCRPIAPEPALFHCWEFRPFKKQCVLRGADALRSRNWAKNGGGKLRENCAVELLEWGVVNCNFVHNTLQNFQTRFPCFRWIRARQRWLMTIMKFFHSLSHSKQSINWFEITGLLIQRIAIPGWFRNKGKFVPKTTGSTLK